MLSVPVPVNVMVVPLAPAAWFAFPGVVVSLVNTMKEVALVNAGESPVMVEVPPDSVATPLMQCSSAVSVFAHAAFAAIVPHCAPVVAHWVSADSCRCRIARIAPLYRWMSGEILGPNFLDLQRPSFSSFRWTILRSLTARY